MAEAFTWIRWFVTMLRVITGVVVAGGVTYAGWRFSVSQIELHIVDRRLMNTVSVALLSSFQTMCLTIWKLKMFCSGLGW